LFTWPEKQIDDVQFANLETLFKRRLTGEPVAYILGEREFWSLPIQTHPSTLIPRPDTEVLVEAVLDQFNQQPRVCVDLGTGSGAIALALKSERDQWHLVGVDRVPDAVKLAQDNANRLKLDVIFQEGSWLSGFEAESLDVVVSNPPYIDASDPHLSEGDVRFEPKSALVAGDSGLADIRDIAQQAVVKLKTGGGLFFEHGWQQAKAVQEILKQFGFTRIESKVDYGGNVRVTLGFKAA
jgi:release factor glutamine methyltransferase